MVYGNTVVDNCMHCEQNRATVNRISSLYKNIYQPYSPFPVKLYFSILKKIIHFWKEESNNNKACNIVFFFKVIERKI